MLGCNTLPYIVSEKRPGGKMKRILAIEMATEGKRSRHAEMEALLRKAAGSDFTVDVSLLPFGPKSLETGADVALAGHGILERIKTAEEDGYSAILLCGALDPCLDYARETTRIPLLGAGRAACLMAASLGRRIGILAVTRFHIPYLRDMVYRTGLRDDTLFASIEIPISRLREDINYTTNRLTEEGAKLIEQGAEVLVLGCTSISESGIKAINEKLGVPVVHPNLAGVLMLTAMLRGGWSHSMYGYGVIKNFAARYGEKQIEIPD